MKHFALPLLSAVLSLTAVCAHADTIPYSNVGTIAPQVPLTAAATGDVMGYFVQGGAASHGSAVDLDYVALYDVTTGTLSNFAFNNQTTVAGTSADFGHVNAGDVLAFVLYDTTENDVATTAAVFSTDGVNHGYVTNFAGGTLNGASVPAGIYVGMEDRLTSQGSDFNYNDDTFVFTNVAATTPTPEPGSLLLLATGICGAAGAMRRRFAL